MMTVFYGFQTEGNVEKCALWTVWEEGPWVPGWGSAEVSKNDDQFTYKSRQIVVSVEQIMINTFNKFHVGCYQNHKNMSFILTISEKRPSIECVLADLPGLCETLRVLGTQQVG